MAVSDEMLEQFALIGFLTVMGNSFLIISAHEAKFVQNLAASTDFG